MSGSKSKAKGNSWERDIASHLSSLYNLPFIRVPNSGAYIGGKNTKRKTFLDNGQVRSFKGDIIPPLEFPKFNCEAKSYADFPFHQLFQGNVKQLETWINQLMDVADAGDFNILIMKFNRKGKFVAVEFDVRRDEALYVEREFIYTTEKYGRWAIMDYDKFFELNKDTVKTWCA
jgi:hypothetical protein